MPRCGNKDDAKPAKAETKPAGGCGSKSMKSCAPKGETKPKKAK